MAWWEVVVLGYGAVLALLAAPDVWHWLRCPACPAARRAVAGWHPGWRVAGASHRAAEPDRDVVAVFYQDPPVMYEPPRYRLVAVDRRSGVATELPDDPDSPYAVRGLK